MSGRRPHICTIQHCGTIIPRYVRMISVLHNVLTRPKGCRHVQYCRYPSNDAVLRRSDFALLSNSTMMSYPRTNVEHIWNFGGAHTRLRPSEAFLHITTKPILSDLVPIPQVFLHYPTSSNSYSDCRACAGLRGVVCSVRLT